MNAPAMQGKDFRALRRLSTKDNVTLAEVGETCERVPAESLAPLLESGHIELAVERRAPSTTAPAAATEPPANRRKVRR